MKAVLLTIKPERANLIYIKEKTLEVRKSRPLIAPCRVYFLETGTGKITGEAWINTASFSNARYIDNLTKGEHTYFSTRAACLTNEQLRSYAGGKGVYFWDLFFAVKYPRAIDCPIRAPQSWCKREAGECNAIARVLEAKE